MNSKLKPQVYTFEKLTLETIKESIALIEYFRLKLIYYQLISGKGLEFDKLREYNVGDDPRRMDWKVLAKAGKLMIRAYKEERNFSIIVVLDVSDSMLVGSTSYTKNEFAAILGGAISFAAQEAGDLSAIAMVSDKVQVAIDPTPEFFNVINVMTDPKNYGGKKNWEKGMQTLLSTYPSDSVIFLISDFIDTNPEEFLPELAANFTKVYGIMLRDPLDDTLPKGVGSTYLQGVSDNRLYITNLDSVRDEYEVFNKKHVEFIKAKFQEYGQLFFRISPDDDFSKAFMRAFGDEEVLIS